MALIYCANCGSQISENAPVCPKCGYRRMAYATVPPPQNLQNSTAPAAKDKTTTALLAILLGGIGVHYFYLGKNTAGILSIVISLFTCGIWPFVMLIQGIMMLTMSEQDFYSKYVNTNSEFPLF